VGHEPDVRDEPDVGDGQRPAVFSIIGPPGAGKSTALLALAGRCPQFARFGVRDYGLRLAGAGDPLGLAMRDPLLRQELLPDELVRRAFARFLDDLPPGARVVAVEGYPRNARQCADLLDGLRERGFEMAGLVVIDIPDGVVRQRVTNRRLCSACGKPSDGAGAPTCSDCGGAIARRLDDEDAWLERRLMDYREVSRWLRAFFAERGLLRLIDGLRSAGEVRAALTDVLRLEPRVTTGSNR
jgi:adenylate kinase